MKEIRFTPTVLFLLTLTIGMVLTYLLPWNMTQYFDYTVVRILGLVFLSISFLLNILAYREFKKSLTPYEPFMKPKVLIQKGVFSVSRNPVYFALVLSKCGLAFVFDSVWILFTGVLLWGLLDSVIVPAEERILNSTFMQEYVNYKKMTRRWL